MINSVCGSEATRRGRLPSRLYEGLHIELGADLMDGERGNRKKISKITISMILCLVFVYILHNHIFCNKGLSIWDHTIINTSARSGLAFFNSFNFFRAKGLITMISSDIILKIKNTLQSYDRTSAIRKIHV